MTGGGLDFRRRRAFPGWGAGYEWPPINPVALDPTLYQYISETTIIENGPPTTEEAGERPPSLIIGPAADEAIAFVCSNFTLTANSTHQTANRALTYPFTLREAKTLRSFWIANGTTGVSGNLDIGIYHQSTLAKITSTGSTAQSGTGNLQVVDVTDVPLDAGRYVLAFAMDNTTGNIAAFTAGGATMHAAGVCIQESAFPLPSTLTLTTIQAARLPVFGLSFRATV